MEKEWEKEECIIEDDSVISGRTRLLMTNRMLVKIIFL